MVPPLEAVATLDHLISKTWRHSAVTVHFQSLAHPCFLFSLPNLCTRNGENFPDMMHECKWTLISCWWKWWELGCPPVTSTEANAMANTPQSELPICLWHCLYLWAQKYHVKIEQPIHKKIWGLIIIWHSSSLACLRILLLLAMPLQLWEPIWLAVQQPPLTL